MRDVVGDAVAHNRAAWDKLVQEGNEWTRPVSAEVIERARMGDTSLEAIVIRHLSPRQEPAEKLRMLRRSLHLRSALGARPYILAAQAALAAALPEDDPERASLTEAYLAGAEKVGIAWLLGGRTGTSEDFER